MHRFVPGEESGYPTTMLLLHGTGGDEDALVPLGRSLAPRALAGELPPWECAMRAYAAYVGARSKRGGYKNQKLAGGDHTALGDARATLRLIERMTRGA